MPGQQATIVIVPVVLPLVTLTCYSLVVAELLRHAEAFAAAISILCFFLGRLWLLVDLGYGWGKAGEWRIRGLMTAYSGSLVLTYVLLMLSPLFHSRPHRPSREAATPRAAVSP